MDAMDRRIVPTQKITNDLVGAKTANHIGKVRKTACIRHRTTDFRQYTIAAGRKINLQMLEFFHGDEHKIG